MAGYKNELKAVCLAVLPILEDLLEGHNDPDSGAPAPELIKAYTLTLGALEIIGALPAEYLNNTPFDNDEEPY